MAAPRLETAIGRGSARRSAGARRRWRARRTPAARRTSGRSAGPSLRLIPAASRTSAARARNGRIVSDSTSLDHAVHGLLGRGRAARRRGEPSPDEIGELRVAVQIVEPAGVGRVEHVVAPQDVDHLAETQPHLRPVETELGQFDQAFATRQPRRERLRGARRSTACPCAAAAGVHRRTARARARRRAPVQDAGRTARPAPPSHAARPVRGEAGRPPREILHGPCLAAAGSGNVTWSRWPASQPPGPARAPPGDPAPGADGGLGGGAVLQDRGLGRRGQRAAPGPGPAGPRGDAVHPAVRRGFRRPVAARGVGRRRRHAVHRRPVRRGARRRRPGDAGRMPAALPPARSLQRRRRGLRRQRAALRLPGHRRARVGGAAGRADSTSCTPTTGRRGWCRPT